MKIEATVSDVYNNCSDGTMFRSNGNMFFIKPFQSQLHHMEGMLVNLFDGGIIHYSHTLKLTPVHASEVPW